MATLIPQRPGRVWLFRALAISLGLAASLVIVEAGLRIFHLAPAGGLATVSQRDFDRLPGLYVPGQHIFDRRIPALPHHITIDSLGYRNTAEFPRVKPPIEIRIVLLGDSFTFGDFVDDDQSLPAQLEAILGGKCRAPIRVINTGVGGTSIDAASEMAERSLPLGIDVAVLTFTENDVTDLAIPMWDQMTANRAAKSRLPMSVVYPVVRRLALWNLLLTMQAKRRNQMASAALASGPASPTANPDSLLQALRLEYRERLTRLRDRLADANIPLVFAIFPSHLAVYGKNDGEQLGWVSRTAREVGLPTVNYFEALRLDGRSMEQLYLLPHDGHPSAAGYGVAAPLLAERLTSLPHLTAACATSQEDQAGVVAR